VTHFEIGWLLKHAAVQRRHSLHSRSFRSGGGFKVSQITADTACPEFRAINPIGKVPTVVFDDGRMLSESGAILHYLGNSTSFWPQDSWNQAQVLRWMFFEQYSHEPAIAVNRYLRVARAIDGREAQVE
jgi:glutathione S-transferase